MNQLYRRIGKIFSRKGLIHYWNERAEKLGERAVLDVRYSASDIELVTQRQMEIIFPIITRALTGEEKCILDFGCGTGRFTKYLRSLINGSSIGVDPIASFLTTAKENDPAGTYLQLVGHKIPAGDQTADIFWCCLVLGAIDEGSLQKIKKEIIRVVKKGSLIAIVENTSSKADNTGYWFYRTPGYYIDFFKEFDLKVEGQYSDFEEQISILIGRG